MDEICNILELGTCSGGMMYLMDRACSPGLHVSMDMPWNLKDPQCSPEHEARFRKELPHVQEIFGNIHDNHQHAQLSTLMQGNLFDLIFQDADHSESGSLFEFEMYHHFLRPGGYFAFHDVRNGHGTQHTYDFLCTKYNHWEFTEAANLFGIGIIQLF